MYFKEALSILSKSSPYSVSTLRKGEDVDAQQQLKDYLYITPLIQLDFENALLSANQNEIFCLCGSSGDGKSEILTKLYKNLSDKITFHLDATHSQQQHKSAIDCLNEQFDKFKSNSNALAIGINIGMLQKFIKFGDNRHQEIKDSFKEFLVNKHKKGFKDNNIRFYDFECYPRLEFSENKVFSPFVYDFLQKLTAHSVDNPFWQYYQKCKDTYIKNNFKVLSEESFQLKLIELLGLVRLLDEQFLIPRLFVDFIFQILTLKNPDGIVSNVFKYFDNELSESLTQLDPNHFRSEALDSFYLEFATNTLRPEFKNDIKTLTLLTGIDKLSPQGIIQGIYLLGIKTPAKTFINETPLQKAFGYYLNLIQLYNQTTLEQEDEELYLNIIETLLISSIFKYANRKLSFKIDNYIVSRQIKDFSICNKTMIEIDLEWIETHQLLSIDTLPIPLIINNEETFIFELDIIGI